jgi:hypothetical protein
VSFYQPSAPRIWQSPLSHLPEADMPIRPETRWFYPIDWPILSREVRFRRARGRCEHCGRPHGRTVKCLPDGRWLDDVSGVWRDGNGKPSSWPDLVDFSRFRFTRVVLATCHIDHNPTNNRLRNLKAWCQRCHILHDRIYHRRQARLTWLQRRALGDLFEGAYRRW